MTVGSAVKSPERNPQRQIVRKVQNTCATDPGERSARRSIRSDEEESASLKSGRPVEYERDDLAEDIAYLATFPQASTAHDLGPTERGWRKIIKTRPTSKAATIQRVRVIAEQYRLRSV